MFIDHVDLPVARTIMDFLTASDSPIRVSQLRVLGGATSRVATDATAYAHRDSRIMVNLAAFYESGGGRSRAAKRGSPSSPQRSNRVTPAAT